MATTFGILAMRAAAASAWRRPSSERWRPRARPGSFTPVVGVRPWRTSRTTVGGAGFLSFITPPPPPTAPPPRPHRAAAGGGGGGGGGFGGRVYRALPVLSTPTGFLHRLPDARGCRGRLAEHHAELAERVLYGVDDGGRARDGAAFAHAP